MLKVAIIGCGKIADQHAEHIAALPGCEIVAVCDREELMAKQLSERYAVPKYYGDVQALLAQACPDVAHITTPPQSHHAITKLCLEAGCHAYVEKPFTMTYEEAVDLVELAENRKRLLTVGHHAQYSHAAREMRSLIREGYLGGAPIHIESYYCYDLGDPAYARALLSDPYHWVRSLPGGLLQNTISHGISKIAEFLTGNDPQVLAYGFTSNALQSIGETKIVDELRTVVHDGPTTAYFTFSSQMRPTLHHFRIFGPKNGLIVDENQQTVIKVRGARYKSYLERFVPATSFAKQYVGNVCRNLALFARSDFHEGHGMRALIREFYEAIKARSEPPISPREILLTAKMMDSIFAQIMCNTAHRSPQAMAAK